MGKFVIVEVGYEIWNRFTVTEDDSTVPAPSGPMSNSSSSVKEGDLLGGRYRVLSLLGTGGMGLVYRVEQVFVGQELALKTLKQSFSSNSTAVRRFQQEAKTSFSLKHSGLVQVHDFGLLEDGTPFFVMDLVNGVTLADRLKTKPLSLLEASTIFTQVCFALAFAHESRVTHRDIKPSNIMLTYSDAEPPKIKATVLDFGIAKISQAAETDFQALTQTGEVFGSPLYMSPEQCGGQQVDHRTDIYSLGCVLFEALSGTPPFVGENFFCTLQQHQAAERPTLHEASLGEEFPLELEKIVQKMLAVSPDERYQNLSHVAIDLANVLEDKNSFSPDPPAKTKDIPEEIRISKKALAVMLFGTSIITMGLTTLLMRTLNQLPPVKKEAAPKPNRSNEEFFLGSETLQKQMDQKIFEYDGDLKSELLTNSKAFKARAKSVLDKPMDMISRASALESIDLLGSDIDNNSLNKLANLPHLKRISLTNTNLDDLGAKNVATCKTIRIIKLGGTAISDSALVDLSSLPQLEEINLDRTNVTIGGVKEFCRRCKTIKKMSLANCARIGNFDIKSVRLEFPLIKFSN